ncbi:hypothetical protein EZV62_011957 [Acer yangbiense]|uniref:Amino acid transporter transmembrane domain-containing protein n=1 Tax=Acer yangbiense TaxID=1000413 RepID=A0A5C7I614_9ROSI|nr:hypothetical protein EZV62_011957 [Acer yangbiense]
MDSCPSIRTSHRRRNMHSRYLRLAIVAFVHGHNTSRLVLGTMYLLAVINSLSSFPIYAMPTFNNLEFKFVSAKRRRCPRRVHIVLRLFFEGLTFFIAVAFPFLGSLAPPIGGITLQLTYVYPSFMRISIRKPAGVVACGCLIWGLVAWAPF